MAQSHRAFFGVFALLFAASAALTIVWCASTIGGIVVAAGLFQIVRAAGIG